MMEPEEGESNKPFVVEKDELLHLVHVVASGSLSVEDVHTHCRRITEIINKYQEQPYVLDPLLEQTISPLMAYLRLHRTPNHVTDPNKPDASLFVYKLVYSFTKVRGYKIVVRFFPHEIVDLEPTLEYLKAQDASDHESWEILGRIPFAFSTMDRGTMVSTIIDISKTRLEDSGKTREAAAELLSRIITRPDLVEHHLAEYMDWCMTTLQNAAASTKPHLRLGVVTSLANIFKLGKRQELIGKAGVLISALDGVNDSSITWRKLKTKLVQRIGMVLLKPLSQNWRYQKSTKTLLQQESTVATKELDASVEEEENVEIPDEIEDVVDKLLLGLKDKDTIVRWSAAKGVGRIASRLPRAFSDDIVEHIIDLFNPLIEMADSAWHGGCLGIAELARRGLLLPSRLGVTFAKIFEALQYDTPCGTYSVGSHVRDAACYVCWSFARAYSPAVLQPYILNLANALITAALFDREINCRRAASAAYQENVGRVGNFPHGIDIIGIADYHAVGNRTEAYTTICAFISKYDEYKYGLVDHLIKYRVGHWDQSIREQAAKALSIITPNTTEYMHSHVMPTLLQQTSSNDIAKRHGSILAVSELLLALTSAGKAFSPQMIAQIRDIVPILDAGKLYRGRGGEAVRAAVSRLVECISLIAIPLDVSPSSDVLAAYSQSTKRTSYANYVDIYQHVIDENITQPNPAIHAAAVDALSEFCNCYYRPPSHVPPLVSNYTKGISTDPMADVRRGYCMAIGALPKHVLEASIDKTLEALSDATRKEQDGFKDAETRQQAVMALTKVSKTMGLSLQPTKALSVLHVVCNSMGDYTTDHRGDVGSWVRLAAMDAIQAYVELWCSSEAVFNEDTSTNVASLLVQQALEKMDKVRTHAMRVLFNVTHSSIPIRQKETLCKLFPDTWNTKNYGTQEMDSSASFGILTPCLDINTYRYHALLGFSTSVGGMGKNVADTSTKCLVEHVQAAIEEMRAKFLASIISIMETHARNDRVIVPTLKSLSALCEVFWGSKNQQADSTTSTLLVKIIQLCRTEVIGSKDVPKLGAFLEFAGCIFLCPNLESSTSRALESILLALLSHRYPLVRKNTAAQLFKYLLLQEETSALRDARNLLQTDWTQPTQQLAAHTQSLYQLLGIQPPKKKAPAAIDITPVANPTPTATSTQKVQLPFDASDEL